LRPGGIENGFIDAAGRLLSPLRGLLTHAVFGHLDAEQRMCSIIYDVEVDLACKRVFFKKSRHEGATTTNIPLFNVQYRDTVDCSVSLFHRQGTQFANCQTQFFGEVSYIMYR
jgi:hypothetical protein